MKPIFRYSPLDAYLVLYAFFLFCVPYVLAIWTPPFVWLLIISLFQSWFIVNCQNSSLHHHTHWTTFNNSELNRYYELFLSAVTGIPQNAWKNTHLLHHRYVNDKPDEFGQTKDPVSVYKGRRDGELSNFWVYCFRLTVYFQIKNFFVASPQRIHLKEFNDRYNKELWAFRIYIISIFLINPLFGLWTCLVYALAFFLNNANSYGEHWGALNRRGDTTQDSIGIYSKWYNIFGFNAGLHQEHHHKPGVHWAKLPEVTPLLHPDRVLVKHGVHITNNPFWSHFVALIKGENVKPK
jgi:fatty acid desaturase